MTFGTVRVSRTLRRRLEKAATRLNLPLSETLRLAVRRELSKVEILRQYRAASANELSVHSSDR